MSDDISHYGVKGMKWGVRKEDDLVGRRKAKTPLTPLDKQVLDSVGMSLADSPSMQAKYGPGSLSKKPPTMEEEAKRLKLTPNQKKALIIDGGRDHCRSRNS